VSALLTRLWRAITAAGSALTSHTWWLAAGQRAARTALVFATPFVAGIIRGEQEAIIAGASTVALGVVISLATSLRDLPELDGVQRPWWLATSERAVRSFFQALVAGIPAVTLIEAVPWPVLLTNALTAAAGSVVLAMIAALPEAQEITVPAADVVALVGPDGAPVAGPASPYPDGSTVALYRPVI
jgi:hypothetical protein